MSSDFEIERRCSHDKKPGIVQLTVTHLVWTPDSAADGSEIKVALTDIRQFQVSKQGSAKKAMIRLTCSDRDAKITLDFGKDFTDRDAIRDVLNKLHAKGASALANRNGSANGAAKPKPPAKPVSKEERDWRLKLIQRKEVLRLRQRLVDGGAVSDETFWHGMKYRYKANGEKRANNREVEEDDFPIAATDRGVPSDAFTAEKKCATDVSMWDGTIPTPAQRHIVFMEYPAVARAIKALSGKMREERIWELFCISSMAGRRGRMSKADTTQTAEADAVFAPFQARENEMNVSERKARVKGLTRGLDLDRFDDHRTAHVLEGHTAGGEARPLKRFRGPDSASLRLMRMVNRHGELIVEEGGMANWNEGGEPGRPLEDLEEESDKEFAKLDVGSVADVAATPAQNQAVMESVAHAVWSGLRDWNGNVGRFVKPQIGSGATLSALMKRMQQ